MSAHGDGPDDPAGGGSLAVQRALDESCTALISLQTSLASVVTITTEHSATERALHSAIESVRLAVEGLRDMLPTAEMPLAYGFVSRRRGPVDRPSLGSPEPTA